MMTAHEGDAMKGNGRCTIQNTQDTKSRVDEAGVSQQPFFHSQGTSAGLLARSPLRWLKAHRGGIFRTGAMLAVGQTPAVVD
jgi:hypothetical protein